MNKPRLKAHTFRLLSMVDEYIRQYDVRGPYLKHAASDVMDGAVFNHEICDPIRQRFFHVVHDNPPRERNDHCGDSWTVHLTDRAIRLFWPDRVRRRRTKVLKRRHHGKTGQG